MAPVPHASVDEDAPVETYSNRLRRPLLMATYALHLISSLIILNIAVYLIRRSNHSSMHLIYWLVVAVVGFLLSIPALLLSAVMFSKGYLAIPTFLYAGLWLTAFIFAFKDFGKLGNCSDVEDGSLPCTLKKMLEAFTFLAFFTCVVATLLEARLWYIEHYKHAHRVDTFHADKYHSDAAPATNTSFVSNAAGAA